LTEILNSFSAVKTEPSWVVIGNFDGVHLGHKALIRALISKAHESNSRSVLITFDPHPKMVLEKVDQPFLLSTSSEKIEQLSQFDLDLIINHPFTNQLSAQTGREFLENVSTQLGMIGLITGKSLIMGHDRLGENQPIQPILLQLGVDLETVDPVEIEGILVSSGSVRDALSAGNINRVNRLMGRNYQISGIVGLGKQRGTSIDLPTANLVPDKNKLLPKYGVYACMGWIEGQPYPAVTNVGVRPTFDSDQIPSIEAHLLDFTGNIYGRHLSLSFLARIRDEHKFVNKGALLAQISKDKNEARRILDHAI
jgi:riboflavin kinase/FMN adenylyltransferase